MAVSLRLARVEDSDVVVESILEAGAGLFESLLNGLLPGLGAQQLLRVAVADEASALCYANAILAESDGEVVGMILCYPAEDFGLPPLLESVLPRRRLDRMREVLTSRVEGSWYINSFVVRADARGQGIGRLLLGFAAELAGELGFDRLSLHVWADNEKAIGLYRAVGFETVREIPVEPGEGIDHQGGMLLMYAPLPLRLEPA